MKPEFIRRWVELLVPFRQLLGLFYSYRYFKHWRRYQALSKRKLALTDSYPCLTDWVTSTPFDPHYFYQAAWLARRLNISRPAMHVDVGSDVRMVSVLSAFVAFEFIDFRPLRVSLDGLKCSAGDVTNLNKDADSIISLSCLHVVEHIGLGRYGDPIDPEGSVRAMRELQRVLAPEGRLYLSLPVGHERVCFNAHRVFDPQAVIGAMNNLRLIEFSLVDDAGVFHESVSTDMAAGLEYGCGLFVFEKP